MILSDACMYKKSNHALIKFEQGYIQEEFLIHLFSLFKSYCFMVEPGKRIDLYGERKGLIKSFWFKTFSFYSFDEIWNLFYIKSNDKAIKTIQEGLILNHLTDRGLAYWIIGDGSLQKDRKTMILHTQSYTKTENLILSRELNEKFGFRSEVILHKKKYFVIKFNSKDAITLHNLIKPYIIESMKYKIPVSFARSGCLL
jgi:LAGLIDADG DNA endonuclease family